MQFRELKLKKDPECPVCGPNPTVTKLIDYEQFCGMRPEPQQAQTTGAAVNDWEITPVELKKKLDAGETPFILDVREPNEYQINRIAGLDADPARRAAAAVSGTAAGPRDRRAVQDGRPQRQGAWIS